MPKQVYNLYFEAQGNYTNIFRLIFPNQNGADVPIFSVGSGAGHPSTGIKHILDTLRDDDSGKQAKKWLQNGEVFKVECGAGGLIDTWSFNSPLYSEELQYGGTMCISAVLSGSVANAQADFKVR